MKLYRFTVWVQGEVFDVHVEGTSWKSAWRTVREIFPTEGLDILLRPC